MEVKRRLPNGVEGVSGGCTMVGLDVEHGDAFREVAVDTTDFLKKGLHEVRFSFSKTAKDELAIGIITDNDIHLVGN